MYPNASHTPSSEACLNPAATRSGNAESELYCRLYIWAYERSVTWRGRRQTLRESLQSKTSFAEWKTAADALDDHLGNGKWKAVDEYAYYDHATVGRVKDQLRDARLQAQQLDGDSATAATDRLRSLVEASLKSNAFGVENPRMYSETYRGTKHLAQAFIEELHAALDYLLNHSLLKRSDKYILAKHLHRNFGRTALCLSGGSVVSRATLPYRTSWTRFHPVSLSDEKMLTPRFAQCYLFLLSLWRGQSARRSFVTARRDYRDFRGSRCEYFHPKPATHLAPWEGVLTPILSAGRCHGLYPSR